MTWGLWGMHHITAAEDQYSLPKLWEDYQDWNGPHPMFDDPKRSIQNWGNVMNYLHDRHGVDPYTDEGYNHPASIATAKLHSLAQGKHWVDGVMSTDMDDDDLLHGAALGLLKIRRNHHTKLLESAEDLDDEGHRTAARLAATDDMAKLQSAIESFRDTPYAQKTVTPQGAAGNCEWVMDHFTDHAERHGLQVDRREFNYPKRSVFPSPHPKTGAEPSSDRPDEWDVWHHAPAVVVNGVPHVVDWSLRQFDQQAAHPHVEPLKTYGNRFNYHVQAEDRQDWDDDPHTAARLASLPDGLHIQPEDDDWVAYHQGTPVGSLSVDYNTEVPSIDSIRVHPDYRRHGIGKALWEAAGRPAHTPDDMSADGQAWARAVGGPRLAMPQGGWYHASPHELPVGTVLTPGGGQTQYDRFYDRTNQDRSRSGHVLVDSLRNVKSRWSDPDHFIYRVEPHAEPQMYMHTNHNGVTIGGEHGYTVPGATITKVLRHPHTASRLAASEPPVVMWHPDEVESYSIPDNPIYGGNLPDLKDSITQNGIQRPLAIHTDGDHAVLADGHHRLMAAQELGLHEVPVQVHYGAFDFDEDDDPEADGLIHEHLDQHHPGWRRGRSARLAMPSWYHQTDNPDFKLDPSFSPGSRYHPDPENPNRWREITDEEGQILEPEGSLGSGIFLTQKPDYWRGMGRIKRPYEVSVETPENVHEHPGVLSDEGNHKEEIFVPSHLFHLLNVTGVQSPHTAARLAMPTWYHLTDDPDFKLDPSKVPTNLNYYDLGAGVFLTQRPEEWASSSASSAWPSDWEDDDEWNGDRPYVAEIDAPDDLHKLPGTKYAPDAMRPHDMPGSEEIFVPADQYHHLTVKNVRSRNTQPKTWKANITTASRLAMPWYHNTDAELNPGDELLPPTETGHKSQFSDADPEMGTIYHPEKVYFYHHPTQPTYQQIREEEGPYSGSIGFGKNTYQVEPVGHVERDPEWQTNLGKWEHLYDNENEIPGYHDYMAPRAQIVRKVEPEKDLESIFNHDHFLTPQCSECRSKKHDENGNEVHSEWQNCKKLPFVIPLNEPHCPECGGWKNSSDPEDRISHQDWCSQPVSINQKEAHLMTAAVTVYTQPSCIQCTMTKKQLDKLGIDHDTVDVTQDPEAHAYVTGLGYTAAPVVVVNDGEDHWAGFKPDRLRGLVE